MHNRAKKLKIVIPTLQLLMLLVLMINCGKITLTMIAMGLCLFVVMCAMNRITYRYIDLLEEKEKVKQQICHVEELRKQEYTYYENIKQKEEHMRVVRHEFANELQIVYDMIDQGASEEQIRNLLQRMKEQIELLRIEQ